MKILIINGPNINMLGIREKEIYGTDTYDSLINSLNQWAKELNIEIETFQSNVEGEIVNFIQKAYLTKADGIVINPAAYTHTSIAILDALKAVNKPAIEVHISDVDHREDFRKVSLTCEACLKVIKGEGLLGYKHALEDLKKYLEDRQNGRK
ncbi:MAG: type II 3-dehydroquinate dehydratase [Bacilli bacterium]|nr:type II 3-dehydroquinate dehydratase [Bacilli bacterium]